MGRAGGLECPASIQKILSCASIEEDLWTASMLLKDGMKDVDVDDNKALWLTIIEQLIFDGSAGTGTKTPSKSQLLRFFMWIKGSEDVPSSVDESSKSLKPSSDKAGLTWAEMLEADECDEDDLDEEPKAGEVKAASAQGARVQSSMMQQEMDAQGATNPKQLTYTSSCVVLGRHATRGELRNLGPTGGYGDHPATSDAIRKNMKASKQLGMQDVTTVIAKAKAESNLGIFDAFIANTRESMTSCPDDHVDFAMRGANLIGQWHEHGRAAASNDMAALEYFELCIVYNIARSRGIPKPYEPELMARAEKTARQAEQRRNGSVPLARPGAAGAPPPSMDAAANVPPPWMAAYMKTVEDGAAASKAAMETMAKRMDAMNAKVDRSNQEGKDKFMTCNKCNKKGHREANCPDA
jgi:hypothetical protein